MPFNTQYDPLSHKELVIPIRDSIPESNIAFDVKLLGGFQDVARSYRFPSYRFPRVHPSSSESPFPSIPFLFFTALPSSPYLIGG